MKQTIYWTGGEVISLSTFDSFIWETGRSTTCEKNPGSILSKYILWVYFNHYV